MRRELFCLKTIVKITGSEERLHGVSLRIYQNEITFIIGKNNCGKRLLARIMAAEKSCESGSMIFDDEIFNPRTPEQARAKGLLYVNPKTPLSDNLSVVENIYLSKRRGNRIFLKRKVKTFLQLLCKENNIDLDLNKRVRDLSLLEKILVFCLRALFSKSKIIIFENLLYLLSKDDVKIFFEAVEALKKNGITPVVLSFTAKYALQYADRLVFMADGRVVGDFNAGECTKTKADDLLNFTSIYSEEQIRKVDIKPEASRLFFYPREGEIKSVTVGRGEILGMSCMDEKNFQWYRDFFFNSDAVMNYNGGVEGRELSVLTFEKMESDYFPRLSFSENIIIPAYPLLSRAGWLSHNASERFIESEIEDLLPLKKEDWRNKMFETGEWEREAAVCCRAVLSRRPFLVLSCITDLPDTTLTDYLQRVINLASARHKCIIIFGQDTGILSKWCHRVLLIDDE